ncbi:MAG: hypothetical protein ABUT20_43485 [Bacteroidota bacterium]
MKKNKPEHRPEKKKHCPPPKKSHETEKEIINIFVENTVVIEEEHFPHHRRKPFFVLISIINNQTFIQMADVKLVVGTPNTGIFALLDNKTLSVITGASFSNQAVGANSNPELADFSLDPSNPSQVIGSGKAAGSGSVVITTDASYTDPGDGSSQSGSFSVTKNYTVVASADGVSFDVQFQ